MKYAATKGTKEIAKQTTKNKNTKKTLGALAGILGNVAAIATESADLRGWTYLPGFFRVARVWVPTGAQVVRVQFTNKKGAPAGAPMEIPVNLTAGERKIVSVRTVR